MNRFLSVSAFVISIIALTCVVLRVDVAISNNTFIAAAIAVIGILATFMVAYQIFTSLDQSDRLKKIEEESLKTHSFQIRVMEELKTEQHSRRLREAINSEESNPLEALHYTLESLVLILDMSNVYVLITISMNKIRVLKPRVLHQLSSLDNTDVRSVEACLLLIELVKKHDVYSISENRIPLDELYYKLKEVYESHIAQ